MKKSIENKNSNKFLGINITKNENGKTIIQFPDGDLLDLENPNLENLKEICMNICGSDNPKVLSKFLSMVEGGIEGDSFEERSSDITNRVAMLEPRNPGEALLAAQFVSLQKAAFRCLSNVHTAEDGSRIEFFINQSSKLFRLANETMQTIVRLRTAGQQVCTVMHVVNNGNAIVAQNLPSNEGGVPNQN